MKQKELKLYSWNVNGIRSVAKKGELEKFLDLDGDIFCIQEIKAKSEQFAWMDSRFQQYWHSAARAGYSGTMVFSKQPVLNYTNNFLEDFEYDEKKLNDEFGDTLSEGRIQTLEFENFYLLNVYTPNSKRNLERLKFRAEVWDKIFLEYMNFLKQRKSVIVCGDFNAAYQEIDLARPKDNKNNAGFTEQERAGIDNIIKSGFVDTYRELNPNKIKYTWWSNMNRAREKNIGWRIDYFFVSKDMKNSLVDAEIYDEIFGSDHCPVSIKVRF